MENKQLIKKYALSLYQIGKKENALDEIQNGIDLQKDIEGRDYAPMSESRKRQRRKAKTGRKLLDESN